MVRHVYLIYSNVRENVLSPLTSYAIKFRKKDYGKLYWCHGNKIGSTTGGNRIASTTDSGSGNKVGTASGGNSHLSTPKRKTKKSTCSARGEVWVWSLWYLDMERGGIVPFKNMRRHKPWVSPFLLFHLLLQFCLFLDCTLLLEVIYHHSQLPLRLFWPRVAVLGTRPPPSGTSRTWLSW